MKALKVEHLKKSFRRDFFQAKVEAVRDVSFSLDSGTVTAFLGGNGAGKTTTIKCILSLLFPDAGEISFFNGLPISSEVRSRIGFLPERTYFYEYLSGLEFLRFYGELSNKWKPSEVKERAIKMLKRVNLDHVANVRLRQYSKGMLQKIGVAQALIHEPELLILDEPMSGLDPDGRAAVAEIIEQAAQNGAAVIFSSHLIHDAERICDRVVMLRDGKTLFEGDIENLLAQSQRGFRLHIGKHSEIVTKVVADEKALQLELQSIVQNNERVLSVSPIQSTLEEIFISKALNKDRS